MTELELYIISIPWLICYWTQFNSTSFNINIQTEYRCFFFFSWDIRQEVDRDNLATRHQPLQCILYDDTYFFAVVQKTICLIASLRWQQDKEGDGMVVELWVLMAARVAPGKRHGGGRLFLFLTYPVRQSQWFNYICELWHCYEKIFANNKWSRIIRQELKVCKHYI